MTVSQDTHVCIGMFRPPWEDVQKLERDIANNGCRCGESFPTPYVIQYDRLYEHYMRGCFDKPVYKTHEEVMQAIKLDTAV